MASGGVGGALPVYICILDLLSSVVLIVIAVAECLSRLMLLLMM
jgi:hypothetical protein